MVFGTFTVLPLTIPVNSAVFFPVIRYFAFLYVTVDPTVKELLPSFVVDGAFVLVGCCVGVEDDLFVTSDVCVGFDGLFDPPGVAVGTFGFSLSAGDALGAFGFSLSTGDALGTSGFSLSTGDALGASGFSLSVGSGVVTSPGVGVVTAPGVAVAIAPRRWSGNRSRGSCCNSSWCWSSNRSRSFCFSRCAGW